MIQGAVFDMDGLMFDTEKLVYRVWKEVMTKNGFFYDFSAYKQTIGRRTAYTKKLYETWYGDRFCYEELRRQANILFRDFIDQHGVPVKKGLYSLLEYLKNHNFEIALATSTGSKTAMDLLDRTNVTGYFDAFICGNMVQNGKPHPEVFLTAAKELKLCPENCIALEDSINGIKAAYAAKMKPVMVPDLLEPSEEIKPMLYALCENLEEAITCFKTGSD